MTTDPGWAEVARQIKAARQAMRPRLSARQAAQRAVMSPTYWQDLERGYRLDGGRLNFSDEKLLAAARVVDLDPTPIFQAIGRPVPSADLDIRRADLNDKTRLELLEEMAHIAAVLAERERFEGDPEPDPGTDPPPVSPLGTRRTGTQGKRRRA